MRNISTIATNKKGPGARKKTSRKQSSNASLTNRAVLPTKPVRAPQARYSASIYAKPTPLPSAFVIAVGELEQELGMPIWLLVQNDRTNPLCEIGEELWEAFFAQRSKMQANRKAALLIDSPGGYPREAYKLARLFRRECDGFVAIVPSYAKSAATLLVLGAERIILDTHAEIGPLDMQFIDPESETRQSALNEVQTLERLNVFALRSLDGTMQLLLHRTGKKVGTILPQAMEFVSDLVRPLMENIDVVRYTEMSRLLKIPEEYAIRLLKPQYSKADAKAIARDLVGRYPEHGFVIDTDEARQLGNHGLDMEEPSGKLAEVFKRLRPSVDAVTAIGKLTEITK